MTIPQREHSDDMRRYDALLARYVAAFDGGDLDALEAIVSEAADDPELDRILAGVDVAFHREAGLQPVEEQARLVRRLVFQHIPSGIPQSADETSSQPLTVSAVAARLLADHAAGQLLLAAADQMSNRRLLVSHLPVPIPVTAITVARLADQLQVEASVGYWKRFRETALILGIARERTEIELAAARRQTGDRSPHKRMRRPQGPPQKER